MVDDTQDGSPQSGKGERPNSILAMPHPEHDFSDVRGLPEIEQSLQIESSRHSVPVLSQDIADMLASKSQPSPTSTSAVVVHESLVEVPPDVLDHVAEVLLSVDAAQPSATGAPESIKTDSASASVLSSESLPGSTTRPGHELDSVRPEKDTKAPSVSAPTPPSAPVTGRNRDSSLAEAITRGASLAGHASAPRISSLSPSLSGTLGSPPTERLYRDKRTGEALELIAEAVRMRASGALQITGASGATRSFALQDGDIMTAASSAADETLVRFLVLRGEITDQVVASSESKLPGGGRRAAAALIAKGFIGPEDLWPVLRAHAEWLLVRTLDDSPAVGQLAPHLPKELREEPNVFGGATGVEVFVEAVRRGVLPEQAQRRLGPLERNVQVGPLLSLLPEAALAPDEVNAVQQAFNRPLAEWIAGPGNERAAVAYALESLQIIAIEGSKASLPSSAKPQTIADPPIAALAPSSPGSGSEHHPIAEPPQGVNRQDIERARALVDEGDYFHVLGVDIEASSDDIRRAFVQTRRQFEPSRAITAATADLADDVDAIVELLEEAYDVLRDEARRNAYRDAIRDSHARSLKNL